MQQQEPGDCGPHSVLNAFYFANRVNPAQCNYSGRPREYLANCVSNGKFVASDHMRLLPYIPGPLYDKVVTIGDKGTDYIIPSIQEVCRDANPAKGYSSDEYRLIKQLSCSPSPHASTMVDVAENHNGTGRLLPCSQSATDIGCPIEAIADDVQVSEIIMLDECAIPCATECQAAPDSAHVVKCAEAPCGRQVENDGHAEAAFSSDSDWPHIIEQIDCSDHAIKTVHAQETLHNVCDFSDDFPSDFDWQNITDVSIHTDKSHVSKLPSGSRGAGKAKGSLRNTYDLDY